MVSLLSDRQNGLVGVLIIFKYKYCLINIWLNGRGVQNHMQTKGAKGIRNYRLPRRGGGGLCGERIHESTI